MDERLQTRYFELEGTWRGIIDNGKVKLMGVFLQFVLIEAESCDKMTLETLEAILSTRYFNDVSRFQGLSVSKQSFGLVGLPLLGQVRAGSCLS